jgi:methylase of polypeptide subunit release factors
VGRGGGLVVEIAPHQAEAARDLARGAGYRDVEVVADLTGRDRVLIAHLTSVSEERAVHA